MKRMSALLAFLLLGAGCSSSAAEPEPKTEAEKALYSLGNVTGQSMLRYRMSKEEFDCWMAGFQDAYAKRPPKVDIVVWRPKLEPLLRTRSETTRDEQKKLGQEFLAKVATEQGIQKTQSGLLYRMLREGTGMTPGRDDKVRVNYSGKLVDGTEFDSSANHGGPVTLEVRQVVRCWGEGLRLMKEGSKAKLYCPPETAYGDMGARPFVPPGATLTFDVELLKVEKQPPAPSPATTPATPAPPKP